MGNEFGSIGEDPLISMLKMQYIQSKEEVELYSVDYPELYDAFAWSMSLKYIKMIGNNPYLTFLTDIWYSEKDIDFSIPFESLIGKTIMWRGAKIHNPHHEIPLRDYFKECGILVGEDTHAIDEYCVSVGNDDSGIIKTDIDIKNKITFPYVIPPGEYINFLDLDTLILDSEDAVASLLIKNNYYKENKGLKDLLEFIKSKNFIVDKSNIWDWLIKGINISGYTVTLDDTIIHERENSFSDDTVNLNDITPTPKPKQTIREYILSEFNSLSEEERKNHIFVPHFYAVDCSTVRKCNSCNEDGANNICFTYDLSEVYYHRRCLNTIINYYTIVYSYKRPMLVDLGKESTSYPATNLYSSYNIHDIHKTYKKFFNDVEINPYTYRFYVYGDNYL